MNKKKRFIVWRKAAAWRNSVVKLQKLFKIKAVEV